MTTMTGRNFLHTPGPTTIPDRVLRAMAQPAVDLHDPALLTLIRSCFDDLKKVFKTDSEVFVYAANGHGAWEAALVNTLSPGDLVLVPETGQFGSGWARMADSLGVKTELIPGDWRNGIDPAAVAQRLHDDKAHAIKAVLQVHTDTATSITSDVPAVRKAIDEAGHPALYLVDTIASLATVDFRMDEWGVDVAVAAVQKGLMQAPGLSLTAASPKAIEVCESEARMPRNYWDWRSRRQEESYTWFCGTAPEQGLFGMREALDMLFEEGLEAIFARHRRIARAVRRAIHVWSEAGALELNAANEAEQANSVTTIRLADGIDGEAFHDTALAQFNVALGRGLGQLYGKAFRIGHMGYLNEAMILGALGGVESCLGAMDVPHKKGGVEAAIASLAERSN